MKLIYKIARTELKNLFYSPVAWFLCIAFLVQIAIFYTGLIGPLAEWQELFTKNSESWKNFGESLTMKVFLRDESVFYSAVNNLYLFLPLLTMGLISREFNGGTIKLLYSSPIKTRHIVLGKYFALMLYNLLLIAILGIFMVAGAFTIKDIDGGMLLSAALGFYLLICTYGAIGIFMSSLTSYQIVSAIATFMVIYILSVIGGLWQEYDFVRDLTYFLSLSGRADKMIRGLITTRDLIYFGVVISMFISFTLFRIRGTREFIPWYKKALRYVVVIVVGLSIGYVFSIQKMIIYWDTTRDKINTIHPKTQAVIEAFDKDEPLQVTLYGNLLEIPSFGGSAAPAARNRYLWHFWEKYLRFKSNITFKYVNYYDLRDGDSALLRQFPGKSVKEVAEMLAEGMKLDLDKFLPPARIREVEDLASEGMRAVMKLEYQGRTTFLRTFADQTFYPDEMITSAAFKRLQGKEMPKILYTSGNLERSIYKYGEREYFNHSIKKNSRMALINLGFDADSINLDMQDIPPGITALIVADPKTELSAVAQEKIKAYLDQGGNAFFFGEPGKQAILNPVLANIGVKLSPGTLVELTAHEMPHVIMPYALPALTEMAEEYTMLQFKHSLQDPYSKDSLFYRMVGQVEVLQDSTSTFTMKPLYTTRPGGVFNKMGIVVTDSLPPLFNAAEGDTRKNSYISMAAFTRNINDKEQRILVAGDADFFSNARNSGGQYGSVFFSWLGYNHFPVYTVRSAAIDSKLKISNAGGIAQRTFFVWILPALVFALGTVILVRRKRK